MFNNRLTATAIAHILASNPDAVAVVHVWERGYEKGLRILAVASTYAEAAPVAKEIRQRWSYSVRSVPLSQVA